MALSTAFATAPCTVQQCTTQVGLALITVDLRCRIGLPCSIECHTCCIDRISSDIAAKKLLSNGLEELIIALITPTQPTCTCNSIAGKAIGGKTAALGSMYLVTGLLSEVLTNNAAAALMYPIAANVGDDMGIPVRTPC